MPVVPLSKHSILKAGTAGILLAVPLLALSAVKADERAPKVDAALAAPAEYAANCAACHGGALEGGRFGTPLISSRIAAQWPTRDALAAQIADTMPPANPGSLSEEAYQKIAAYIFDANGVSSDGSASAAAGAGKKRSADSAEGPEMMGVGVAVDNTDAVYREVLANRAKRLADLKPVSNADLRDPPDGDWLQPRRTDDGHGFSPLKQIDKANVAGLTLAWAKALPAGSNSIAPLVRDGVLFLDSANTVMAIDVASGDTLWQQKVRSEAGLGGSGLTQPRSIAIFEDLLYVPTLDNKMIALNIRTGEIVWERQVEDGQDHLNMTAGPIVVNGKLIQGTTGCYDYVPTLRGCFIVGLDAKSGKELWRFNTIPVGNEKGANTWNGVPAAERIGGGVWSPGTYDPSTNLVYFGIAQSYHISALMLPSNGKDTNDGLFTDSTVALDPDTGKLVWYYQHLQREVWDLDWAFERTVFDVNYKGRNRRAVGTIGKIGILDVLDAKTGKYLFSYDMGMQNLVIAIDPRTGRKTTDPKLEPQPNKAVDVCPDAIGVRNWPGTSYDASRGLLYVTGGLSCMELTWYEGRKALDILYAARPRTDEEGNNGFLTAIDVTKPGESWSSRSRAPLVSAALATAGGVVFGGGVDRRFRALDSDSGEVLWQMKLDNIPTATPIAFADGDTEYVAVTAGGGAANDVARAPHTPEIERAPAGTTLWVFKLPGK